MDNIKKELFNSKKALFDKDTESQTFGCRHTNPDICSNNSIPDVCAFTSKDCVCKRPQRSWKKMFKELKEKEDQK